MERPWKDYLVVLSWPDGFTDDARAAALESVGVPRSFAMGFATKLPPFVVGRLREGESTTRVGELQRRGVPALAVPMERVAAGLRPLQALTLAPAIGAPAPMYMATFRRDEPIGMLASDIRLLIRGTIVQSRVEPSGAHMARLLTNPLSVTGLPSLDMNKPAPRRIERFEVLDIHLSDDRHVRIDARRFNFRDMLGPQLAPSDTENLDRLTQAIGEQAADAEIDVGFLKARWLVAIAPDFKASFAAGGDTKSLGAFAVYSAFQAAVSACRDEAG